MSFLAALSQQLRLTLLASYSHPPVIVIRSLLDILPGVKNTLKVYEGTDVRNVALIGHGHSGKTTLTAGVLSCARGTNRLTRVDEGNTITDYDDDEIQRKLTISTGLAFAEWAKKKINLIDTPGFNIFINDTKASMIPADAALVL